ncbi:MAG: DUF5690 family protein [Verrucomicrobiota bacterium]
MENGTLRQKLATAPALPFSVFAIFAAFTTYFCMYGFRKGFGAAGFADAEAGFFGSVFAMKTALVISQLLGYALSKFIGVKINSEMPRARRAWALIGCIAVAELALLGVAVLPPVGKVVAIFFNGLPLGMVWGVVFSFLEGRRLTELLGAGLCCSFIIASGFAKTVGRSLIDMGVTEYWMPFATGLCFLPFFLFGVWLLCQLPDPTPDDETARVTRKPMDAAARRNFLKSFMPGLVAGFITYIGLTIFRDYRDNFALEILEETGAMGAAGASIFTKTELPIAFTVIGIMALLFLVKDNRKGFFLSHLCALGGLILLGLSTVFFTRGTLGPVGWLVASGFGTFLAYVPFNCIFYDRMIAALGTVATSVFCIMVADALGYTGVIGVMIFEQVAGGPEGSKVDFFRQLSYIASIAGSLAIVASWFFFRTRIPTDRPASS